MRTREEQVAELVDALKKPVCRPDYSVNILKIWLETHIREAEERVRAECAADTRRLEWLGTQDVVIGEYGTDKWKEVCLARYQRSMPADLIDIRVTIDAAMEGGK